MSKIITVCEYGKGRGPTGGSECIRMIEIHEIHEKSTVTYIGEFHDTCQDRIQIKPKLKKGIKNYSVQTEDAVCF